MHSLYNNYDALSLSKHMQKDDASVRSSINDKLQFLKQTLACELHKMNCSSSDTLTITPSQDPHLTSTHHYPHTVTQSTTGTSDRVENDRNEMNSPGIKQVGEVNQTEGSRVVSVLGEVTGEQEREGRVQEVMGDGGEDENKSEKSEPNTENQSASESHVSTEPDSVQLVSYNCSSEMEEAKQTTAAMEHSGGKDDGDNRKGDSGNSEEGNRKRDSHEVKEEIGAVRAMGDDRVGDDGDDGNGDRGAVSDNRFGERSDNGDGERSDNGDAGDGGCSDRGDKDTGSGDSSVSDIEMVRGAGVEEDPVAFSPLTAESRHSPLVISPGICKHMYSDVHVK